jgi:hypothetical protein
MTNSPLSRFAAPIVIVGGAMVVITRMVSLAIPTELEALKAYVLTATFAINSVSSIVAFALLALALVAVYDREARPSGTPGFVAFGAAMVGTVFMAGDWWYEAFAVPRIAEIAPQAFDTFVGGRLQIGGLLSFALFGLGCHPRWWPPIRRSHRQNLPDRRGDPWSGHSVARRMDGADARGRHRGRRESRGRVKAEFSRS